MSTNAVVKYRSMRSSLANVPLSLYSQLVTEQARPGQILLHLTPLGLSFPPPSTSSSTSRPPSEAWLGWSGLSSSTSLPRSLTYAAAPYGAEPIELDPEVAHSYHWPEGTLLSISVERAPPRARSVTVSPVSADDWEIIERHAAHLEDGLLGQLRGARRGAVLSVWVKGRLKVQVRVDETDPVTKQGAVLLLRDTEVYVAPKTRGNTSTEQAPVPAELAAPDNARRTKRPPSVKVRLVPGHIAQSWAPTPEPEGPAGPRAYCSAHTLERARRKLAPGKTGPVRVCVRPLGPRKEGDSGDAPKEGASGTVQEEEEDGVEVYLQEWGEVPHGHLISFGRALEGFAPWDRLVLTAASTRRSQVRRPTPAQVQNEAPSSVVTGSPLLPGMAKPLQEGADYLRRALFVGHGRPLLLTGPKGSGKTSLARGIASSLERDRDCLTEVLYHDVGRLDPDMGLRKLKDIMAGWLEEAERRAPALVLLDGLDMLVGPETELQQSGHPAAIADYFTRVFAPANIPPGVVVLCTASSTSALHPLLGAKHVWGETVRLPALDKEIRQEILRFIVDALQPKPPLNGFHSVRELDESQSSLDYVSLAGHTEGYSAADLKDLVQAALQQAIMRIASGTDSPILETADFELALTRLTPASLRGVTLHKFTTTFSDIGGLHQPRQILRETLEWPTRYAQIFSRCPLRLRSGLLLYGYPGCGKTLLASAVAASFGLNFISVKGPELLNKYIGASEKAVRDLFERAQAAKPAVLFFDEFESIAPRRGHDSTGVTDRVVNQLLTEMDGAQGLEGVYVLAATSRPDLIDPALLRPGRLDKSVLCDMPGAEERAEILRTVAKKLEVGREVEGRWDEIGERTEGWSGADLQALLYNAHLGVVHEEVERVEGERGQRSVVQGGSQEKGREVDGEGRRWRMVGPEGAVTALEKESLTAKVDGLLRASETDVPDGPVRTEEPLKPVIQYRHLLAALEQTRPSVSSADYSRLTKIYRSFSSDRDGALPNGEAGRHTGSRVSLA